jgi:hypothetical protein
MSRYRTVHVRTRPRHTPAAVSHENGCFHYCLPRIPAFRSLARFPNLCGPLCVDATPFSRWFQAFAAAAHLHAACEFGWWWTGTQVEALSVSGRVGECWFRMSNIVLMLLALFFRWRWGGSVGGGFEISTRCLFLPLFGLCCSRASLRATSPSSKRSHRDVSSVRY